MVCGGKASGGRHRQVLMDKHSRIESRSELRKFYCVLGEWRTEGGGGTELK